MTAIARDEVMCFRSDRAINHAIVVVAAFHHPYSAPRLNQYPNRLEHIYNFVCSRDFPAKS